ncbi:MAG: T9SS type A sorting domain-containing protein [Saprospiraceae bacterium]
MKFSFLLLLSLFITLSANAQWDLIATQPATPHALAIDNCGNGFARIANRVYRTADLGQTWEAVLDVPGISNPSYRFNTTAGTVNLSVYSTQSGVLYDYEFACDGTVRTDEIRRNSVCERLPFEVIRKGNERIFTQTVYAAIGISSTHGLAIDEGLGNGLEMSPSVLSAPYFYRLGLNATSGDFEFSAQPSISTTSIPTPPSIAPLDLLNQDWMIEASEEALDLSFSDYSLVVSNRDASGLPSGLAVATYSVASGQWSTSSIDPLGFESVLTINHDQFLFQYSDRLELRSATSVASLISTTLLPVGFQLHYYSKNLAYVIGMVDDRVVIISNNTVANEAALLPQGFSGWTPTLAGSILIRSATGFEEYSGTITSSIPIDLDVETRYVSVDTVGPLVYLVRQLNDRQQLLVKNPDGSIDIVVNALAGATEILDGGDDARIVRIDGINYRLGSGVVVPLTGRLGSPALTIRGADTLFIENGAAFVKRGGRTILINIGFYTDVFVSGGVYLIQFDEYYFGPRMRGFSALVVDIQTLELIGNYALLGPLECRGESLLSSIANGVSSGGPFASLYSTGWNGQRLASARVGIPTYISRSTEDLCNNGQWQSFTQTVNGYSNVQYLNGTTYISGRHGVYKTDQCLAPETQQEQACLAQGQTIAWNGLTIDQPGLYVDTSTNSTGCDRISYLQVGKSSIEQISECYLEGTTAFPGTYVTDSTDAGGCIQIRELSITNPDTFRLDTMLLLGDVLFGKTVILNGQQITTSLNIDDCTEIYVYTISLVSSTAQVSAIDATEVYPTLLGSDRIFHIRTAGQAVQRVEVFTLSGKQVELNKTDANTWQLTSLQTGWFVVRVQSQGGLSSTRVLVQ